MDEKEILKFWKENKIFEKTLEKDSPKGEFVFYDGPPFATGLPHYGSLLSSVAKDLFADTKQCKDFMSAEDGVGLPWLAYRKYD